MSKPKPRTRARAKPAARAKPVEPPRPDTVERWRTGRKFFWHRKAANGKIVSQAGPFMTGWGALRNARKVNHDLEVR